MRKIITAYRRLVWADQECVGGYAKESRSIPVFDALLYVGITVLAIWSAMGFAKLLRG